MKITDFIGESVFYDDLGGFIFGNQKDGTIQMLLDVRGWGAIQQHFKTKDGGIDEYSAVKFQDEMAGFFVHAINEKLQREKAKLNKESAI